MGSAWNTAMINGFWGEHEIPRDVLNRTALRVYWQDLEYPN